MSLWTPITHLSLTFWLLSFPIHFFVLPPKMGVSTFKNKRKMRREYGEIERCGKNGPSTPPMDFGGAMSQVPTLPK